jgi:quinol monooxygenase YgiN
MSKRIYCIAQFKPKPGREKELFEVLKRLESNTLREDGCIHYVVTRKVESSFAPGESYPIVFNECWESMEAFEAHCQRREIVQFFEAHCADPDGLAEANNVCVYTDEPENYDRPVL